MPTRFTPILFVLLASAAVASAEPLPWSYYVRVNAPDGYDGILFGTEVRPPDTDGGAAVRYSHIWDTEPMWNYGMVRINISTMPGVPESLFSFGPGFEETVETVPADKRLSPGVFQLAWGFTPWVDGSGGAVGSTTGTISADGLFTSGTGNYRIGLDYSERVTVGGRSALLRFNGVNTESGATIQMTVTPDAPSETPEPGTLILGGIALAGGLGAWVRKRRMANAG